MSKPPFTKFTVNYSDWGFFSVYSQDSDQYRTLMHQEDCRRFIQNAIETAITQMSGECGDLNDGFKCNRYKGHDGDHYEMHPNGGKVGWLNRS